MRAPANASAPHGASLCHALTASTAAPSAAVRSTRHRHLAWRAAGEIFWYRFMMGSLFNDGFYLSSLKMKSFPVTLDIVRPVASGIRCVCYGLQHLVATQ